MSWVMRSQLTVVVMLFSLLAGCASHSPSQVQIEDRNAPAAAPMPSSPTAVPSDSQPPAPTVPVAPAITTQQQAPATLMDSAPAAEPTGAVLALLEQAENQHQQGLNEQALSTLERAQRIAPRQPLVYLQLARLRLDMGDPLRAEQLARKGLTLSGGNPRLQEAFRLLIEQIKN